MATAFSSKQHQEARQTLEILFEISQLLNCGLDKATLSILVSLIEHGINPEALATVVKELRRETQALKAAEMGRRNGFDT